MLSEMHHFSVQSKIVENNDKLPSNFDRRMWRCTSNNIYMFLLLFCGGFREGGKRGRGGGGGGGGGNRTNTPSPFTYSPPFLNPGSTTEMYATS